MYYARIIVLLLWVYLCYGLSTPVAIPAFIAGGLVICLLLDFLGELI